jgi:hypothetical protein
MAVEAFDWNVVVVGFWNPAILTPAGIGKRLFGLEKGTPIAVEIPLDGLAPSRVRHDGLTVTSELGRLAIVADAPSLANLNRARVVAARAIRDLPQTPLTACGFNIRFKFSELPERILAGTKSALDDWLSDVKLRIISRTIGRSIEFENGMLNLTIRQVSESETNVELNFDRQSANIDELLEWLEQPINDVMTSVASVLTTLEVSFEEKWK